MAMRMPRIPPTVILMVMAKVIVRIPRSSTTGLARPKLCPKFSHWKADNPPKSCPRNPPSTTAGQKKEQQRPFVLRCPHFHITPVFP